jgi:hypothetical protein
VSDVLVKSETAVTAKADDGAVAPVPAPNAVKYLLDRMKIMEVTVSVKESRQHAQYLTSERFVSGSVDLSDAWKEVQPGDTEGRLALGEALTQRIMGLEAYLYERLCHMQKKNNLIVFPRDPNNPFVKEGVNYAKAIELSKNKAS